MASKVIGGRGGLIDVQMEDAHQIAPTWQAISLFPVSLRDAEKSSWRGDLFHRRNTPFESREA